MKDEDRDQGVEMVFLALPCRHEAAGAPHDGRITDYEPLSRDGVASLLNEAAWAPDVYTVAALQCRLGRAVPGHTCPGQVDGPAADQETRLYALFVDRYREGGTPELVGAVWSILAEGLVAMSSRSRQPSTRKQRNGHGV
jgi:hypothetical protein